MSSKNVCAEVLAIENNDGWNVIDQVGDMALCHFRYSAKDEASSLRGTIVDTAKKCIVAPSFGYHQILVSDTLEKMEKGFKTADVEFEQNATIYAGTDGIIVRAFMHNSQIYLSSFKNIDLKESKSNLYATDTFWNLYHQSGGPNLKNLFDTSKKYSAWVYHFLVVHEDVLTVSKQPLEQNRKVYMLHAAEVLKKETCVYTESEVDWHKTEMSFQQPKALDLDQANQFLLKGHYPELDTKEVPYQAQPGEYVAIYEQTEGVPKITMVHSRSYHNRYLIKHSRTNLRLRFFQVTDYARNNFKKGNNKERYLGLFPPLEEPGLEEHLISLRSNQKRSLNTFIDKIINIWINFVLAMPLTKQAECKKLLVDYLETQKRVAQKMMELYQRKSRGYQFKHRRIQIILENWYYDLDHRKLSNEKLYQYCYSTIKRETGSSLFMMDKQLSQTQTKPSKLVGSTLKK